MSPFIDKDFLLTTPTARTLYHDYAEAMPIVDYHCHVDPKAIFEDRRFTNITEAWLEGDHYKWRLMRWGGVEERYITGDAPGREKFQKFSEVLPRAIGNPLYHWCHLELSVYFGYQGVLNGETAQEVWDLCAEKFSQPGMSVRGLIARSNVAFIGTTDDPCDSLEWHRLLADDPSMKTTVAPSFRPDAALNIEKAGWSRYIARLGQAAGMDIRGIDTLEQALRARMEHFDAAGCRASDHGLEYVPCCHADRAVVEAIFQKGLRGEPVSAEEAECFKTALLLFCGRQYAALGWAMQIHYNCMRNPNSLMFERLGPDTGFDSINAISCPAAIAGILDALYRTGELPKTILYSLNSGENELLASIAGAFQGSEVMGKIQHGSGWWYNDTKSGMIAQMTSLANVGVLGTFIGMLTDSRSFLSYTRHAYFRRILCELIGGWVEHGEYPADLEAVGAIVQDICCRNALRYFGIES